MNLDFDVLIVGGGPGGLSAALALGRARKRVLLCDSGPRRNALAEHLNNFVTRDGVPPAEFRREARAQLAKYPNVECRDVAVESISGSRGAFTARVGAGSVRARRVVLATGLVDVLPELEGLRALWGHAVFQCPYCHGWEVKERRWGYLAPDASAPHVALFALQLRAWSSDVTLFANGLGDDARRQLLAAKVHIESADVKRLAGAGHTLEAVELGDGRRVPCDVLFMHPPQRQVGVVTELGVALDEEGFVKVDPMSRETSIPGVYAAGDLTTRMQAAVIAAAAGMHAAAFINAELTAELATSGAL